MKNINWKKLLRIVIPINVLAWIIGFAPLVIFQSEGMAIIGVWNLIIMLLPILIIGALILSSCVIAYLVQENRLKHFFVASLCSCLIHLFMFLATSVIWYPLFFS